MTDDHGGRRLPAAVFLTPSTPSWMTSDQRGRRRQNSNRRYGRRSSVARKAASALDFEDDDDDEDDDKDDAGDDAAGGTRRSKEEGGPSGCGEGDEVERRHVGRAKKNRPNLPRPPPRAAAASRPPLPSSSAAFGGTYASSAKFESRARSSPTPDPIPSPRDDDDDAPARTPRCLRDASSVSSDGFKSKLSPPPSDAVRRPLRRSHSQRTATSTATSSASSMFEENVHPNDVTETPVKILRSGAARRSTRLAGLSSSVPSSVSDCSTLPSTTAGRTNPRKRPTVDEGVAFGRGGQLKRPSPPKIAAAARASSAASFSSGSFSSSTSGGAPDAPGVVGVGVFGSESFSSLARQNSGRPRWPNSALNTPAARSTNPSLRRRCLSDGENLGGAAEARSAFTPMSSSSSPDDECVGTNLSTPSAASSSGSSRKRRTMESTFASFSASSPPTDGTTGGPDEQQQRARSRGRFLPLPVPPPPFFLTDRAIDELATTTAAVESAAGFFFSSPPASSVMVGIGYELDDDRNKEARDQSSFMNNESMMSTGSDDEDDDDNSADSTTSEEGCDDAMDDGEKSSGRELSDTEIFDGKPSHEDFKFLTKSLQKWSHSRDRMGASMGLNNGCLIAVPPNWKFERRANFARWVATSFGFRIGSVGGGSGGSFLRCNDAEGRGVLARLLRILNNHSADSLVLSTAEANEVSFRGKTIESKEDKPNAMLSIKLSSVRTTPIEERLSPSCDVGVELADDMNGITLDEKKPTEKGRLVTRKKSGNYSEPHLIRSMALPPLATKIKNIALPCLRQLSPGRRFSGGRPPRLSSESAIHISDFMRHLHPSPSPLPMRFSGRSIRERASRALLPARRPSLENTRCSFERPIQHGCSKPFESPHPRNNCLAPPETPSARQLDICLETPMPKQADDWGSRPVFGKDWGESVCCTDGAIDACYQIFAKSWFTSDFCANENLSAKYQIDLDEEDKSFLFAFYDGLNTDKDDEDSEFASINGNSDDDLSPTQITSKPIFFSRCDSVGASALDLLHLDDNPNDVGKPHWNERRRAVKLRKYARMSMCAATAADYKQPKLKRCYRLSETPQKKRSSLNETNINSITGSHTFSHVLSFLSERDLIHSASLVSTRFADVAAEALGNLMLASVGCDPWIRGKRRDSTSDADDSPLTDAPGVSRWHLSVAKSLEKGYSYLMHQFPWAHFLSDGAFKKVFKVWNHRCGAYEALSVMDVDAIDDMGNLNLVGTELAVSAILSSLARRNICPNFVVTRGVFKCAHEPPATLWGCRDFCAPGGITYDGHSQSLNDGRLPPRKCGNYQYIRMELCENGDVENFIRNLPDKMLTPWDCRNLLFQMAFALHVAADRFGLKHYDVKLLNFLLQSAKDPTIAQEEHPHVVLRYGIGSHVFRLRMNPLTANIAKLADYGTSVMRTDTDGQPISLGQFTTLENTPPDFLILGNAAEQGYGHDCFGLGLCMLHLFTGHGPYEEILDEVFCPDNLKGKLRSIWRQKSHDVIHSVMLDDDENGMEIEDQTLFDTMYRYLVVFGIPKKQFGIKTNGKVWRAINSTLLPPKGQRSNKCPDFDIFNRDRKKFSLSEGNHKRIADARRRLAELDGAMELLLSLVSFDPKTRATPLDVINSRFMAGLIEDDSSFYCEDDIVKSYTAYLTN